MIFVIFLNCIVLALYDYSDRDSLTPRNQLIDLFNVGFTSVFILEGVLKVVSYGFVIHPSSYLRNGWNVIDAVVLLSG